MSINLSRPKGTKDIFGEEMKIWELVEKNIKEICYEYNMNQIRTPVFEDTSLFARGVGDETDIVTKEMYTFLDKSERSITLRPELTAGIVRAYIENGFNSLPSPLKLWYIGNMYRYEKMQKGRYREFSQFGIEIFGSDSINADVETISVAYELFKRLNLLDKITLKINSIGCKECRKKYIASIKEYLKDKIDNMCDDCKIRYNKNPMRIIDCKQENCKKTNKNLPMITDYLCNDCKKDFENLKISLDEIEIKYEVDKKIVRGLDYYNKTVFEFESKDLNLACGGGGRYDTLVETLGSSTHVPAIGFGLGMDRIVILLKELNKIKINNNVDIYFAVFGENTFGKTFNIVTKFREKGYSTEIDIFGRSLNAQMKYANKINAKYVCIIGEEEIKVNKVIVKNMKNSSQEEVDLSVEEIEKCLRK